MARPSDGRRRRPRSATGRGGARRGAAPRGLSTGHRRLSRMRAGGTMSARAMRGRAAAAIFAALLAAASWADRSAAAQEPTRPANDYDQRALEVHEFKKASNNAAKRVHKNCYYKYW